MAPRVLGRVPFGQIIPCQRANLVHLCPFLTPSIRRPVCAEDRDYHKYAGRGGFPGGGAGEPGRVVILRGGGEGFVVAAYNKPGEYTMQL